MSPLTLVAALVCILPMGLLAQAVPALSVDAAAGRHAISPDIYGINDYADQGLASQARVGVRRWGGDATSTYNWLLDTYNSGGDYFFEDYAYPATSGATLPDGSQFDAFMTTGLTTGTKRLATIPVMGWLPNTRANVCSYSVAKYGAQQKTDPYHADCGNGYAPDGTTKIVNDPNDANTPYDQTFAQQWINYLTSHYGSAEEGGVQIWSLDNEPEWWFSVHMDIHPSTSTYDEMISRGQTYAAAIKAADPTALITGPVAAGWSGYFYSATDFVSGWSTGPDYKFYSNPVDRLAHGNVPFVEWYMQQMSNYEAQHGTRLLDYVDVHGYITPNGIGFGTATDPASTLLRLTSTRVFWDPNYAAPDASTPDAGYPNGEPPYLIPRMLQWVANDYPGTKTAITEYNWGAVSDITGAVAEADLLGIFGREGLDLATMWAPPNPNASGSTPPDPTAYAFKMYLNYDGSGNQFGETGVSAISSNPDQLSIFAAQRSDSALTIMVLNKTATPETAPISVANFESSGTAQVWQYSSADLTAIERAPDAAVGGGSVTLSFPAYSITLLVLPEAPASLPQPQPIVAAVGNAASYDTSAIAPGEIAVVYGSNLGPASLAGAAVTSDGDYLSNNVANVRVLFNGVPGPIVYASAGQVAAIVPYYTALSTTAAVQVEVQGVRSAPFSMQVTAANPGIFSHDGSGQGQGAILNQDLSLNSSANPAKAGDIVVLYATGEGQTTPPGVDGRLALDIRPTPAGACGVTIGGQTANVSYCGAAPYLTSGLIQINVQVPSSTAPGNVPVALSIGGVQSPDGVTVAIH